MNKGKRKISLGDMTQIAIKRGERFEFVSAAQVVEVCIKN
jgi:hypothetical protein